MLAQFFPKQGLRRAIFNNFADFFSELQYDNKSHKYFYNVPTYLNKNQQKICALGKLNYENQKFSRSHPIS